MSRGAQKSGLQPACFLSDSTSSDSSTLSTLWQPGLSQWLLSLWKTLLCSVLSYSDLFLSHHLSFLSSILQNVEEKLLL